MGPVSALETVDISRKRPGLPEPELDTEPILVPPGGPSPEDGAPPSPPVPVVFVSDGRAGAAMALDPDTAASLGLVRGQSVRLGAGGREIALRVRLTAPAGSAPGDPGRVFLSPAALAVLALPPGIPLRLAPRDPHRLEAGPFIGILGPARRPGNPYAAQTTFFRRLIAHGRRNHLGVFVFSTGEVDWARRRIRGWVWTEARGWMRRLFPFPHAVYDRTHPTAAARAALRRFHRLGIPFFNSPVGSKWWQHQVLKTDPVAKEALPATRLIASGRDLAAALRRHGSVYVKAAHGGKGIDIWRITALGGGRFAVQHTNRAGRTQSGLVRGLAPVMRSIAARRRPYVVQERLTLMQWGKRIFDIRVLAQKDGAGRWHITGMGLRVGPPGSIVSNLHGGGRAMPLEPVLEQVLRKRDPGDVRRECHDLALRIAHLIDGACTRVGELGIDLALDTSERIWFLEANSATGRNVLRRLGPPEIAQMADVRPLEYAAGLAGFL